jgi:FkbM family methyltransferase
MFLRDTIARAKLAASAPLLSKRSGNGTDRERIGRFGVRVGPLKGMTIEARDGARPAYFLGTYERHVVQALRDTVRPGSIAYDVGAHIGYMSMTLSRLVGPSGRVFSFEADPASIAVLERNIARNRLANVTVINSCVSNSTGTLRFATFPQYSSVGRIHDAQTPDDARVIEVNAVSLDAFVFDLGHPAPDVIKVDVEGAEAQVIAGGRTVLAQKRPAVIAEVRGGDIGDAIFAAMREIGYSWRTLTGGTMDMATDGLTDILFTA